jgi:hypothetical protein
MSSGKPRKSHDSSSNIIASRRLRGWLSSNGFFTSCNCENDSPDAFDGQGTGKAFPTARLFLQLIVHLLIGFRELRHADCYRDDPLVQRVLGFEVMPDVATLSRMLKCANAKSVSSLKKLVGDLVLARFIEHPLARITLDFDGSVQSTKRRAQGTAVGYNKKRKGVRSYYPLFCTIAQTGQVLNFLHRAGNVHDSKGARAFVLECVRQVRDVMPGAIIEIRMDSAFFSDEIVSRVVNLLRRPTSSGYERTCDRSNFGLLSEIQDSPWWACQAM